MRKLKKILSIIMVSLILLTIYISPLSAKTTVKVAYPIQNGMSEINDGNVYSGYTYDYLNELERFTHFKFEYVTLEGDENEQIISAMEKVQNGELDMMGGLIYDESLTSMYDYTSTNYGMGNMALYVLSNNANINDTNIYSLKSLDVGIVSSKQQENVKLKEFGDMNGISIKQHFYETSVELLKDLDDQKIEAAAISEQANIVGNYRVVATFSPRPFYFVTTKGKSDIISEMNEAMTALNKEQPSFMSELHDKYFSLRNDHFILTDSEKEYVKNHPEIEVAILGGKAPFQSKDSRGNIVGITIDLLDYIGELSGIKFKYNYTESYDEYLTMLEDHQNLIAGAVTTPYYESHNQFSLSKSFVNSNVEIIMTKGLDASEVIGKRLAIPKGTDFSNKYQGEIVYYDTAHDCFNAVDKGLADYAYLASHVAIYYNSTFSFENVTMIPQSEGHNTKNCIAVRKDDDISLMSIINKGIDTASFSEIQSIVFKNATYAKEDLTFVNYIQNNPAPFISIVVVLSGIYFFSRYYTNKKNNEKVLKELNRFQQISDLSGDCFIEYNVAKDMLTLSGGAAKLLCNQKNIENYIQKEYAGSEKIKSVLENKRTYNEEVMVKLLDETSRWQRVFLQPIFDEKDQLTYIIGKITDIQSQKEEQLQWKELARKDSLTKIYNSATCRELISEYLESQTTNRVAFIILDIDNFKGINDNFGHFYGDQILQNLVSIILQITSSTDVVGRVGGDEFIIVLKNPQSEEWVIEYCQKLRNIVHENLIGEDRKPMTISMGIAFSQEHQTYDEIYQNADKALYAVKKSGRNNYRFINTLKKSD